MSNSKSYEEYLEKISANFDISKDKQTYQNEQLIKFKTESKFHINFTGCHVAISPNGGLIGICKKHGFLDITKGSLINKNIIVMHQTNEKHHKYLIPIDWPYFKQYFILFDFNEKEQLYGICNDASIYKIDILTQRANLKLTSEILKQETIHKAQLYKEGFIALTGEKKIYYIKQIKNPIPDLIIDLEILDFSKNIEFLVIPEEVSKSKKLELLLTNEKGNGVIHIEKSEDGRYYIVPLSDNDNNNNALGYKEISIIQKDKLLPYITNVIEDKKSKLKNSKKEIDIKTIVDNLGKIVALAISPSKKNIALYDVRGIIYFFNSTLDQNLEKYPRIKVDINLKKDLVDNTLTEQQMVLNYSQNFQFLFCGEDTIAIYGLRLIFLVNKYSGTIIYKLTDLGDEQALKGKLFAKLIQEIDGIRYLTDEGIFFISKVNRDLLSICDPFSKSSTKKLLKAYEYYVDNSPNSEKSLREISNYLPRAINSLQIAAGNIFWTVHYGEEENNEKKDLQLFLLKAAQFGKVYLNEIENEFNYDKFVENCKEIKCVNNLRNHSKFPRMITFNEYKNMDSKDLIKKIMRNLNFGMAFEICHFLEYSDKKVYQRYAVAKIKKISKNINRSEEDELFNLLKRKLENVPNFSFLKLAKKAFKYRKKQLGKQLLDIEKSPLNKIPQYIEDEDWDEALKLTDTIFDKNVINAVLHKMYKKVKLDEFLDKVCQYPSLEISVVEFLNSYNPDSVEKYIKMMKNLENIFFYYLEKYFLLNELKDRKKYLNKARECLKLIENSKSINFDYKFYRNYIDSLENNIKYKTSIENKTILLNQEEDLSFDISIYDTYKIMIKELKEDKIILLEKNNSKTFGYPLEGMSLIKLTIFGEGKRFPEMEFFLKKYNGNIKKLGLTNLNVTEIYYKYKKYDKAVEYLKNINEPFYLNHKVNMLQYIEYYELALEVIISEKKLINPADLVNNILILKPNLKEKVDELCEKYKVKLQLK